MKLTIRPAKFSDLLQLGRMAKDAASSDYSIYSLRQQQVIAKRNGAMALLRALAGQSRPVLVAEQGKIVGVLAGVSDIDSVAIVNWLYVSPEYRGQQVAQKLLKAFEIQLPANVHKMMVWTEIAGDYYQKLGWKKEAVLPNHWWGKEFVILAKYRSPKQ